jgi:hypothetical protein
MSRGRTRWLLLCFILLVGLIAAPLAYADDPVLGKPPAKDATFVAAMDGFDNVSTKSLVRGLQLQEGLVIRQSSIVDGKIVIPPAGLYYTTRAPLAKALQGDQILMLGKLYYLVDYTTRFDVVKDVTMKVGDCTPIGDGTKCWELSSISKSYAGQIPAATFQILKPSGNYYGTAFRVATDPLLIPAGALAWGSHNPAGSLLPGAPTDWQNSYYDNNVATSGQSYVVSDKVTGAEAHLLDAGTGAINSMLLTAKAPVTATLAAGKTMDVGKYKVRVAKVDTAAKSVDIEILSGTTVEAKATFGPVTDTLFEYLPEDPMARAKVALTHKDIHVHLNVFGTPFSNEGAALVAYTDMFEVTNPGDWPGDTAFAARPDT